MYTYDDAGQLLTVTDALLGTQNFAYDAIGNVTSVQDEKGKTTTFQYDVRGRRTKRTNPAGNFELYGYDLRDNLTSMTTEMAQVFTMMYDDRSQLTKITAPANGAVPGDVVTATYDPSRRLATANDSDSTLALTYDDVGRLQAETSTINGSTPAVTLTSAYDLTGSRTSLADSLGGLLSTDYDGAGRLARLATSAGNVDVGHDASGRISGILFPSGAAVGYDYEPVTGRLQTISHSDPSSAVLAAFTMGYDAAGSITSIVDTDPSRTREFGYDALQRLTSEQTLPDPAAAYGYDAAGNRTTSPVSMSHVYDTAGTNRLVSDDAFTYAYDDNGNQTSKTAVAGGQTTTYRWDSRSQLVGITLPDGSEAYYRYDALGRRIEKTVGSEVTRYIYDGRDIALETDGAGALVRRYRHGDGVDQPLVIEDEIAGENFFVHADHLGSVRLVTDETGAVASEYDYDAYGRRTAITEGVGQPYAFTGREWDAESGLYYYRARYYDPATGRFLSEDPIDFAGGDLNLYRYVGNGPLSWRDPSGQSITGVLPWIGIPVLVPIAPIPVVIGGVTFLIAWDLVNNPAFLEWMLEFDSVSDFIDALRTLYSKGRPKGFLPADEGTDEWARRHGVDRTEARNRFHGIKDDCGGRAREKFSVNPDTGEVLDGNDDPAGYLGDGPIRAR